MKGVGKQLQDLMYKELEPLTEPLRIELSEKLYRNIYRITCGSLIVVRFNKEYVMQHAKDLNALQCLVQTAVNELQNQNI